MYSMVILILILKVKGRICVFVVLYYVCYTGQHKFFPSLALVLQSADTFVINIVTAALDCCNEVNQIITV